MAFELDCSLSVSPENLLDFFVCFVFRFGMDGLTTNTSGMMTTDLQDLSSQAVSTNPSNPADVLTAGTTVSPEDAANAVS